MFDWGKYYEKDGKIMMPVSVQAHHSFVDGIHIGEFADRLEKYLADYRGRRIGEMLLKKPGYEVFGKLEECPENHCRYDMKNSL